jgi:hypothetical protein
MPGRRLRWRALTTARGSAGRFAAESDVGTRAADVLEDRALVASVLAANPPPDGMTTTRTPAYLAWRYGFAPLSYRIVTAESDPARGFAVVRVRCRGRATEVAVSELFGCARDPKTAASMLREVADATRASYVVQVGRGFLSRGPFVRIPRAGPLLVCRRLDDEPVPALPEWKFALGDVELF